MFKRSLLWRVALPYILLILILLGGMGFYLIATLEKTYQDNLRESLTADARVLAELAAPLVRAGPPYTGLQQTTQRMAGTIDLRITFITPDGTVISDSQRDPTLLENHLNRPEVQAALRGEIGDEVRFSTTLSMSLMYLAAPILDDGRVVGVARVARPLAVIQQTVLTMRRGLLAVLALALLVSVAVALLATNASLQPLRNLTRAVQSLGPGEFDLPEVGNRPDEIGRLGQAFGRLSSALGEQITALSEERGTLAAILQNMTDGVLIADGDGLVRMINPAAARLFGVDREQTMGRSLVEVVRNHQVVDLWRLCRQNGELQSTGLEINPERLYMQVIISPLESTIPGAVLMVFQDVTRLRRLEIVRRDFVSNVSHELRTPLASLKALTETLQEGALDDPPAARRFLLRMDLEIDNLTQMVQELLELSRIESGRVPLRRQPVRPEDLIDRAVERMQLQAERAALTLHVECADGLPGLLVDRERMEQVLVNLLHNAIKFTPPGGEIVVSGRADGRRVILAVRDTGVGIPADALPRIFERFYKTDAARSTRGTGLGLSIARHLVESHEGRIWAESDAGQGSTFFISLPAA